MTSDRAFEPSELTVAIGTTVVFTNDSSDSHTVTAAESVLPPGAAYWASGGAISEKAAQRDLTAGLISPGETYEVELAVPGIYRYYCIPHSGSLMSGTIVVAA